MYWSHFGMNRQPFRAAVDPDSYFPAPAHEEVLAALSSAFARRDFAVLVDGPTGVGKSLVVRKWLERLPADTPRILVPNSHAERPAALLQAILFDLGKTYQGLTESELRLGAIDSLLETASTSTGPVVLILDEAQHLSPSALEELRMLGNVEVRGGLALFAVLAAQPTLRDALRLPAYELFTQRLAVQTAVTPLTADESADYLRHQVRVAGGAPDRLVDGETLSLIAAACGGIPRVMNRAAALAFDLAASMEAETVDVEAGLEAIARLGRSADTGDGDGPDDAAILLPHPLRAGEPARSAGGKSGDRVGGHEEKTARGSKDKPSRKRSV